MTVLNGKAFSGTLRNGTAIDLETSFAEFRRLSLIEVLNRHHNERAFSIHPLICDWMKFRKGVETRSRIIELTNMLATFLETCKFNDLPLEVNQETTRHVEAWVEANENILQDS